MKLQVILIKLDLSKLTLEVNSKQFYTSKLKNKDLSKDIEL